MAAKKTPPAKGDSGDYQVGYGKPPKHTQFKPGKSGNPQGRPKGTKNLKTDLIAEGRCPRGQPAPVDDDEAARHR
jgi:hypothetical protein